MPNNENLILTGWGHAEYVVSAAAALTALGESATIRGMSRRRLPEYLSELAAEQADCHWKHIWIFGIALDGEPRQLANALEKLNANGIETVWISALPMPTEIAPLLADVLPTRYHEGTLLEAVGQTFKANIKQFLPFLKEPTHASAEIKSYFKLIEAAKFYYRNYQDESLYAKCARYLANSFRPAAWEPDIKSAVEHYERYGSRELRGKNRVVTTLQERINRVAAHEHARVLILGESGTGKETVAQQIHNKSPRAKMPFIAFNCASVTRNLLEDRFFGHEKGAFTNAVERTDGLFLQADGGTLFLDEIGEMPLEMQALLLRVLEGGRFMRVGGHEEIKCNVRLITATNRDLPKLVRDGLFREDLYQRLNVVLLRTPSLREHKDDIPIIANAWWRKFHNGHVLSDEQIAALLDYGYPGNVRELINILDRAIALEENDFALLMREHKEMNAALIDPSQRTAPDNSIPDKLEDAIRLHVRRVYEKYDKNQTRAAEALGISRNTMRKYL